MAQLCQTFAKQKLESSLLQKNFFSDHLLKAAAVPHPGNEWQANEQEEEEGGETEEWIEVLLISIIVSCLSLTNEKI